MPAAAQPDIVARPSPISRIFHASDSGIGFLQAISWIVDLAQGPRILQSSWGKHRHKPACRVEPDGRFSVYLFACFIRRIRTPGVSRTSSFY